MSDMIHRTAHQSGSVPRPRDVRQRGWGMRAIVLLVLFLGSASALHADTVTATWDPNSESDIAGYLLGYGTASGQENIAVPVGNVTTWQLSLAPGQRYYFVIQAYNTGGLYSLPSAEAFIDIPNPVPSITPSATTGTRGAAFTATAANGPGNRMDWVGLFATGAPSANSLQWKYLNGTQTAPATGLTGGTPAFTMPDTAGTYQLRFFLNNTLTVLATSATVTVTAGSAPTVTPSATTGTPGAPFTTTVANGPGHPLDWVGLFATGAPSANSLQWKYLNGTQTAPTTGLTGGTPAFTMPDTSGTYQLRFFLNNSLTVLATSATITVAAVGSPTVTPSATTGTVGAPFTATVANGPGHPMDWVGLYATGAPSANSLQWKYLNSTQTAPATGLTGGTPTFTMPNTPGTYQLRFFLNNTLTVLATSATITVAAVVAPTVTPSATTGTAGAPFTATVANGPGHPMDWVGLFATGAPSANSLQWQYLNGTQTAPATGLSGGTLTMRLPLTQGTYELRFFLNNTLTVLATSATLTVQ
jgi:hypothetical protein